MFYFAFSIFSENLNGKLYVFQSLRYQRYPDKVFSTNVKTQFLVNVIDHFQSEEGASWKYKWFENETYVRETQKSSFVETFAVPTNVTLRSEVLAKFTEDIDSLNSHSNARSIIDSRSIPSLLSVKQDGKRKTVSNNGLSRTLMSGYDYQRKAQFKKDGNFTAHLHFKGR